MAARESTESPARPILRFEALTRRFGNLTAVDELTLDVFAGEFFALLGPSGSGKSTLLRLAAGFEAPDQGRILLHGADIGGMPPHLRPLNMMFQNYALFPHMTVAGNVAFGLKQERLPKDAIRARVDEMLALVQLEGFADRKPDNLSGGQRQRVALARALAKHPKVLLLDEPLAALDKKLRDETQFELMQLQKRLGTTFVIVTHDQEEAMTVASRMAVMDSGRIAQIGTPAEIYEQPNSRYVAEFIGDVNILPGRVAQADAAAMQIETEAAGPVRSAPTTGAKAGDAVWVALRPEKLHIGRERPADPATNVVAGMVAGIGYLGDVSVYNVRISDRLLLKAEVPNRTRTAARVLQAGDAVWLSWAPDAAVILTR